MDREGAGHAVALNAFGLDGVRRVAVAEGVFVDMDLNPVRGRVQLAADGADMEGAGSREIELVVLVHQDAAVVQLLLLPNDGIADLSAGQIQKLHGKRAVLVQRIGLVADSADIAAAHVNGLIFINIHNS